MNQKEFLTLICEKNPDAIIVGSIGTISYDLADIPHKNKILIRGAMGAALGCSMGIALTTEKMVLCIIGEGSYLMQMGAISTILRYNLRNLQVIIMRNGKYASCGGQQNNFDYIYDQFLIPLSFDVCNTEPNARGGTDRPVASPFYHL